MVAGGDRHLDLGADAVGAGREVSTAGQGVEARERPDADSDLLALRGRDQRLDPLQHALVGLDVDAGRGVRQPLAAHTSQIFAGCGDGGPGTWSDFSGISNCILSISSCCGTGTGYEPSKQARQNSCAVPRPIARIKPGIER